MPHARLVAGRADDVGDDAAAYLHRRAADDVPGLEECVGRIPTGQLLVDLLVRGMDGGGRRRSGDKPVDAVAPGNVLHVVDEIVAEGRQEALWPRPLRCLLRVDRSGLRGSIGDGWHAAHGDEKGSNSKARHQHSPGDRRSGYGNLVAYEDSPALRSASACGTRRMGWRDYTSAGGRARSDHCRVE